MIIGSRVLYPEEVGLWDAELLQISVYHGMQGNLSLMRDCARRCRDAGIRYVVHPVEFSPLSEEVFKDIREMAEWADLALILHDVKNPDGERLNGEHDIRFRSALEELASITTVSFENATDTGDVRWFWSEYADSITLDIGHVESSGRDSVDFVKSLDDSSIKKIQFVHIHRNNGWHGGITDHWPINSDCREVRAFRELIKRKPDVSVILEINEVEETEDSLNLLREIGARLQ